MAETRSTLTNDLVALKDRLFGPRRQTKHKGSKTVAVAASKTKTAKTAKKPAATKTAAKATASAKPAAKPKAGKTGKAAVASVKTGAKKVAKRATSTTDKIVKEAKEVIKDVLNGAATGALKGAAEAVGEHLDEAADDVKATAKPAKNGKATTKK